MYHRRCCTYDSGCLVFCKNGFDANVRLQFICQYLSNTENIWIESSIILLTSDMFNVHNTGEIQLLDMQTIFWDDFMDEMITLIIFDQKKYYIIRLQRLENEFLISIMGYVMVSHQNACNIHISNDRVIFGDQSLKISQCFGNGDIDRNLTSMLSPNENQAAAFQIDKCIFNACDGGLSFCNENKESTSQFIGNDILDICIIKRGVDEYIISILHQEGRVDFRYVSRTGNIFENMELKTTAKENTNRVIAQCSGDFLNTGREQILYILDNHHATQLLVVDSDCDCYIRNLATPTDMVDAEMKDNAHNERGRVLCLEKLTKYVETGSTELRVVEDRIQFKQETADLFHQQLFGAHPLNGNTQDRIRAYFCYASMKIVLLFLDHAIDGHFPVVSSRSCRIAGSFRILSSNQRESDIAVSLGFVGDLFPDTGVGSEWWVTISLSPHEACFVKIPKMHTMTMEIPKHVIKAQLLKQEELNTMLLHYNLCEWHVTVKCKSTGTDLVNWKQFLDSQNQSPKFQWIHVSPLELSISVCANNYVELLQQVQCLHYNKPADTSLEFSFGDDVSVAQMYKNWYDSMLEELQHFESRGSLDEAIKLQMRTDRQTLSVLYEINAIKKLSLDIIE